jgi:hypothetical protein
MRLALVVATVVVGCGSPRPVGPTTMVAARPQLAASMTAEPQVEQPLAPRERAVSECRQDRDCNELQFGFCGYASDDRDHSFSAGHEAVLHYRGRVCLYALCAGAACRSGAVPKPSPELALDD